MFIAYILIYNMDWKYSMNLLNFIKKEKVISAAISFGIITVFITIIAIQAELAEFLLKMSPKQKK